MNNSKNKDLVDYLYVIYFSFFSQIKQSLARSMFRFSLFVNPLMNTLFLYEMFKISNNNNYQSYVVLSAGLMGIWTCTVFSTAGDIGRERYMGTLSIMYLAPVGYRIVLFGKMFANIFVSLLSFLISLIFSAILAGKMMEFNNPGLFLVAFSMTLVSIMVLGRVLSLLFMLTRKMELYMNLIEIPFIFICGFSFPVEILPAWIQRISNLFATTWTVRMLRMSMSVVNYNLFWNYFWISIVEIIILIMVRSLIYKVVNKRVQVTGSLEVC